MKILLIGSGGRESAIAWKLSKSPLVEKIYIAPSIGHCYPKCENLEINENDFSKLLNFAKDRAIDLTVVGPEVPLSGGITDIFEGEGLKVFGPRKREASLEGSKKFAKEFMLKYKIPTAKYEVYKSSEEAMKGMKFGFPVVVKADGLCAGKGVLICNSEAEANEAVRKVLDEKIFKEAGAEIVVEEFLDGEEVSLLCFVSHNKIFPMESARDFKRIGEGDTGLNTGGVACMSPAPIFIPELLEKIKSEVIEPIERGLAKEKMDFTGVLFIGFMICGGEPKVLEFNARFGDPETEVVLPRLESDLCELLMKAIDGSLGEKDFKWSKEKTLAIICTSSGYPSEYKKGFKISGLDLLPEGIEVFHNGTVKKDGDYYTNGGRVLTVWTSGETHKECADKIYNSIEKISFEGIQYRKDIKNYT